MDIILKLLVVGSFDFTLGLYLYLLFFAKEDDPKQTTEESTTGSDNISADTCNTECEYCGKIFVRQGDKKMNIPIKTIEIWDYEAETRIVTSVKSDGEWEQKKYDKRGNIIYRIGSSGFWTKYKYNEHDKMVYVEDSNGKWTKCELDERDRLIFYEDSNGDWSRYEYSGDSNKIIYCENSNGVMLDNRISNKKGC